MAAVVAGLVAGHRAPLSLGAHTRLNANSNWLTIRLFLESVVFLVMGLNVSSIVTAIHTGDLGIWRTVIISLILGTLVVVVRAVIVLPMIGVIQHRNNFLRRCVASSHPTSEHLAHDVSYHDAEIAHWRDGAVLTWGGMRGAVTLAAAQTLPLDTPDRNVLLLIALFVATGSLIVQGLTLTLLIRMVKPHMFGDVDLPNGDHVNTLLHGAQHLETIASLRARVGTEADVDRDQRIETVLKDIAQLRAQGYCAASRSRILRSFALMHLKSTAQEQFHRRLSLMFCLTLTTGRLLSFRSSNIPTIHSSSDNSLGICCIQRHNVVARDDKGVIICQQQ
ncbi:cation:proton antiporter domain-containing protein [Arcanobacterium canis]